MTAALSMMLGLASAPAAAAPLGSGSANIIVDFKTPEGVPGLAILTGKQGAAVATKISAGTSHRVDLKVTSGRYEIEPQVVMAGTLRYVGVPSPRFVTVRQGQTATVEVTYHLSKGVQEAHISAVTANSLELSWTAPEGTNVLVRRTAGDTPAMRLLEGDKLNATATGLTDSGLKPGTQYNYSIWAKPGDRHHGVDDTKAPLVITVSTADPGDALKPTYAVKPGTLLPKAADINSVTATGSGVQVRLAEWLPTPAPGAAVVLPRSDRLQGGFLGVVTGVSQDGRTIDLTAGGLGDAFDYFHLKIDDLSSMPTEVIDPDPTGDEGAQPQQKSLGIPTSKEQQHRAQREAGADPGILGVAPLAAQATSTSCSAGVTPKLEFDPKFDIDGHFETKIDKYNFLGVDLPKGASLDADTEVTITGAMNATVSGNISCEMKLPTVSILLVSTPVPISYVLKPTVDVNVDTAISVSNMGLTLMVGYEANGYVGFDGSNHFEGNLTTEAKPLTPNVDPITGGIGVKLSASSFVGPGAGTTNAGVLIGLGDDDLTPLDAHAGVTLPIASDQTPCFTLNAAYAVAVKVSAQAWLGGYEFSKVIDIPGLQTSGDYPFMPWHWPTDCHQQVPDPSDDVLGDGVTKVDDQVTGSAEQWGYLEGLTPGSKAWVLSSGRVADAQGSPSFFASSDMGNPGDSQLSAYSGYSTFDAAAYQVTLVPTGSTLRVRYAFASEEYPEYVGSQFNDVMAIFVDGQNCAVVPGTNTPVAINTINHQTNSQYYVDNSTGASGYNTSYDGITTPLECSVPVKPGEPVTVRVAVADASDSILDSAIALIDKGIWSE